MRRHPAVTMLLNTSHTVLRIGLGCLGRWNAAGTCYVALFGSWPENRKLNFEPPVPMLLKIYRFVYFLPLDYRGRPDHVLLYM